MRSLRSAQIRYSSSGYGFVKDIIPKFPFANFPEFVHTHNNAVINASAALEDRDLLATRDEGTRVTERKIGIIMNGVTGRMGMHQHLVRSILSIRNQGGIKLPGGEVAIPDPILVGRNE